LTKYIERGNEMNLEKRLEKYTQIYDIYVNMTRFRSVLKLDPETGCYNWTGAKHVQGYGMAGCIRISDMKRIMTMPHRIVMRQVMKRPLLPNEDVTHLCGNPSCCNPKHLHIKMTRDKKNLHADKQISI